MAHRIRQAIQGLFERGSLRRRLAYSFAIVRLILVPVIFLSIYYLFVMGRIVDRIVNEDAPAATLAQQGSIEMLVARRAERTFLLLHDPASIRTVQQSLSNVENTLRQMEALQPGERNQIERALASTREYGSQFQRFVPIVDQSKQAAAQQVQMAVQDYEKNLDELLRKDRRTDKTRLLDDLRAGVASFDDQITKTIQAGDPAISGIANDLQNSSEDVMNTLSDLEQRSWGAVQNDHSDARLLWTRAEWALSIVSVLTFLLSAWISFFLPRQLVRPLARLKEAVDCAVSEGRDVDLSHWAGGELGELAESLGRLIAMSRANNSNGHKEKDRTHVTVPDSDERG